MKKQFLHLSLLSLLAFPLYAEVEGDPAAYCKQAAELYQEDDIAGAVEEAKWCLESLEQIQQSRKSDKFAKDIDGWKRGEVNQHKAMGFSIIETSYSKDGKTIEVSFNSGGGGMAAMISQMGMAGGGKKIRLGRYTGMIVEEGGRNEILVSLKMTQGMLNLASDDASIGELTAFAKAFPVKEIDQ
ncbi:MAG: hypothetical protein PVI97_00995 [Candidatus Thiodiazotropha sp.]|jgi:hypothetical protein